MWFLGYVGRRVGVKREVVWRLEDGGGSVLTLALGFPRPDVVRREVFRGIFLAVPLRWE